MRRFRFVEATKCLEQSDDGGKTWKVIAENYTKARFAELWESGAGDIREDGKSNWITDPEWPAKHKAEMQRREAAARSADAGSKSKLVEAYQLLGLSEADAKVAAGIETAIESKSLVKIAEAFKQIGVGDRAAQRIAEVSAPKQPERRKKN